MKIAMAGLGRMGLNMARRLIKGGHKVVAYNRSRDKVDIISHEGAVGAYSLEEAAERLDKPRIFWLMLPAGPVVDDHIDRLVSLLSEGDIIIDGGNSFYKDDITRSKRLEQEGIRYMDAGVSGGIWGLTKGYCLMIGGCKETFIYLKPLFESLAPKDGFLYCGPPGAGHFVKMVHNGIEYGLMQAYGEGFEVLESSPYSDCFNYRDVSHLWNQGSVIRSWLLELAEEAFGRDERLSGIKGYVEDSGEGRWMVQQAVESGVSAPVTALSLMRRFESQREDGFSDRFVAALRREFGGHSVREKGGKNETGR
jgi:6-phosphogluconate dehydrogenase